MRARTDFGVSAQSKEKSVFAENADLAESVVPFASELLRRLCRKTLDLA